MVVKLQRPLSFLIEKDVGADRPRRAGLEAVTAVAQPGDHRLQNTSRPGMTPGKA